MQLKHASKGTSELVPLLSRLNVRMHATAVFSS
jgi:hypothetical protein